MGEMLLTKDPSAFIQAESSYLDQELQDLYACFGTEKSVITVDSTPEEAEAQREYARFLGNVTLSSEVESKPNKTKSLADLVNEAADGDIESLAALETNAHITVIETILKEGNVTRVHAGYSDEHGLMQFGHRYHDIQTNALSSANRPAALQERIVVEGQNWKRLEAYAKSGRLKDYWFVVISMVPDNATLVESKKEGFFVDTMTAVVQATSEMHDGIVTESGFMVGKEATKSDRHDLDAARRLYTDLGVENAQSMTTTDFLSRGILIPKQMMPNGVTDVVEMLDNQLGEEYFYGERRPRQDYASFPHQCMEREQNYAGITEAVVQDMIAARAQIDGDPARAFQLLYDLAKQHAVERAMTDSSIDANVFGKTAAQHIIEGRAMFKQGDMHRFDFLQERAKETAQTTACGGGSSSDKDNYDSENADTNKENEETSEKKWMKCPFCKASVFGDPCAAKLSCWDCNAKVVNGKVVSKGNGGSRQRQKQQLDKHKRSW